MDILSDLWKKAQARYKFAFFGTVIFGILSHGMGLFNKYSVHDDLNHMLNGGNPLPLGRWMLYLMRRFERLFYGDGNYSLPTVNGFITILCIGISVCILISLMDIRSSTIAFLLGGAAVSIPVVTGMFGYMFTAHYYGIALLLAVSGAALLVKWSSLPAVIGSILLLTCSVGTYQAYIPVILSVFLFSMIKAFSEAENREQRIILYKKLIVLFFSCIAFMALYVLIMNFFLRRSGIELTNYKNLNTITGVSLREYLGRIPVVYREFFRPSGNVSYNMVPGHIRYLYYGILAAGIFFMGRLIFSRRKNPVSAVILIFLTILIPLSVNFIFMMVEQQYCSALMMYGYVMLFTITAWAFERSIGPEQSAAGRILKTVSFLGMGALVLMYCRYDNICYLRINISQTEAIRYYSTLVTRIQSTEGYNSWLNVSYIGVPHVGRRDNSVEEIPEFEHIRIHPYYGMRDAVQDYPWKEFLRIWCGYTPHEVSESYFRDDPEVQAMPRYPDDGSIKVIRDTVVIKF